VPKAGSPSRARRVTLHSGGVTLLTAAVMWFGRVLRTVVRLAEPAARAALESGSRNGSDFTAAG
jgi:hypothetical protein